MRHGDIWKKIEEYIASCRASAGAQPKDAAGWVKRQKDDRLAVDKAIDDLVKGPPALTFEKLREHNVARTEESEQALHQLSPAGRFVALDVMLGEVARLMHDVKLGKLTPSQARVPLQAALGDVQSFLDLLAVSLDVDLGEATRGKWNETSEKLGSARRL